VGRGAMPRSKQLDGMRAVAFLSVFAHHTLHVPLLWVGVDAFFVLSGFLITGILLEAKANGGPFFGPFYLRRAIRILPPYCIAIALSAMLFSFDWGRIWYWYAFFAANIGDSLGRGGGGVLEPLWSLAVEEQFYLLCPLIVYFVPRRLLPRVLIGAVILAPLFRIVMTLTSATHFPVYFLTPCRMDLLAAGGLLAMYRTQIEERASEFQRYSFYFGAACALAFVCLTVSLPSFRTSANSILFNSVGYSLSVGFFTSVLAYVLVLKRGPVLWLLRQPELVFLEKISYMMYLVHQIAIALVPSSALIALLGTILFSALSWKFIEEPLLGWGKRIQGKADLTAISANLPSPRKSLSQT
jgi:peptidoglycan/LPS O-acetylase OafA/YrhL